MITTTSADGTAVLAADEGRGPAVLVLHPGSDDGRTWGKVAGLLAARFRVVRLHRRQYRLGPPSAHRSRSPRRSTTSSRWRR